MSLAGLKKQLNKANQFVSEKIGNAEGTKATDEYIELERQTDVIHAVVDDMVSKTKEVLHPNPALRARMAVNSRINSTRKSCYPHPEKDLGECMTKYGTQLKDGSAFGRSLVEVGETFKELTEIKSKFEDRVKTRFLDPLNRLQTKDINDCMHHRKKLEGRRLDYDCKRRKISRQSSQDHDPDVKLAESKYNESFNLATVAMKNLLDNEEEQIPSNQLLSTLDFNSITSPSLNESSSGLWASKSYIARHFGFGLSNNFGLSAGFGLSVGLID
ncbi:unnamed protein product [Medioppia subpectinata]|uniref:BAR domain-containing protein n=1 Tax=Medioppia subpectinata TaxID=1979941 RepID=A0A7R9PWX0_9ACAR|nr:unnamed protein product [Medioppia subpectinata]CAG2104395.1 unnamed protein product [Medioppia subpectinata]